MPIICKPLRFVYGTQMIFWGLRAFLSAFVSPSGLLLSSCKRFPRAITPLTVDTERLIPRCSSAICIRLIPIVFVFFILIKNLMHLGEQFLPCLLLSPVSLPFIKTAFTDRKNSAPHPRWTLLFSSSMLDVCEKTILCYFFWSCTKKPSVSCIKPVLETYVSETGYPQKNTFHQSYWAFLHFYT